MNGQRNRTTAFLTSPLCGLVVQAVLFRHKWATEAQVETEIGEVLRNVPKQGAYQDNEAPPENDDVADEWVFPSLLKPICVFLETITTI